MAAQFIGNIREEVQRVVEQRRFLNSQPAIGDDSQVWAFFNNDHYQALLQLVQDPFRFNPENFDACQRAPGFDQVPARGTRARAAPEERVSPTYYVRSQRFERAQLLHTAIENYVIQYPADAEWAQGVEDALSESEQQQGEGPFFMLYLGVTLTGNADTRLEQDIDSTQRTRFVNWTNVTGDAPHQWLGYDFVATYPVLSFTTVAQFRGHPFAGLIEDIWIKAAGPAAVNSANGGFAIDWTPSADDLQLWNEIYEHPLLDDFHTHTGAGDPLGALIRQHFVDHSEFLDRLPDQQLDQYPSDELVANVTLSATPRNTFQNADATIQEVPSIIACYDIPRFAFNDGMGFYDEHDHSATALFFQQIDELVRPAIASDPEARGRRAFIDMHPMDLRRHRQVGIPFTSRYMRITRPIVVLGMGQHVYTAFCYDALFLPWRTDELLRPRVDHFLDAIVAPNDLPQLEELLDLSALPTRPAAETFSQSIGQTIIVNYGPDDDDLCIYMPFRHPGSLRYNPGIQALAATEIFLTMCCAELLENVVRGRLEQDQGRPTGAGEFEVWLQDIRAQFNQEIAANGLLQRLEAVKAQVQEQTTQAQHERMDVAVRVRNVQLPGARGIRTRYEFQGAPGSAEREAQLAQLLAHSAQRQARGAPAACIPRPFNIEDVGSQAYRTWFLARAEGVDMWRSAVATGRNPMAGLTQEQREDYLRVRHMGPFAALRTPGVINHSTPGVQQTISTLINRNTWTAIQDNNLIKKATCSFCADEFLSGHNTYHRCPQNNGNPMHSQLQGLLFFRILYAHDIIDDDTFALTPAELAEMHIRPEDAVDILNQHGRNQWGLQRGELGPIYIPDGVPRDGAWELVQAMDKAISNTGFGLLRLPNDMDTDRWLYDGAHTKKYLIKHVTTLPFRRGPFVVASCGEPIQDRCRYASIVHPTRNRGMLAGGPGVHHPRNRQHTHLGARTITSAFGDEEATEFWHLPIAAKRYLWMNFSKRPTEHDNEDPTLWSVGQILE